MDPQQFDITFYEFKKVLGYGGQGQVLSFQLKDEFMLKEEHDRPKCSTQDGGLLPLPTHIALKVFEKKTSFKEEFLNFERISKKGGHENVIKVYGHCEQGDKKCLVMEQYDKDLEKYILDRVDNPCSYKEATDILLQLANALKQLKDVSIFHRDLNPKNILVRERRGHIQVILASILQSKRLWSSLPSDENDKFTTPLARFLVQVQKSSKIILANSFILAASWSGTGCQAIT